MDNNITVEVAYATPERQKIIRCRVAAGVSLLEAAKLSGISDIFPDLDLETADFGIWGKSKPATTIVADGQRIEIYRPLLADPKESRRRRANKKARKAKK
ncbi:MAG: RnfH family protein [Gammaproteobacteria bacterium]|nr:MAG: RnfH family protein [Gammaproteobacteria bacterium]